MTDREPIHTEPVAETRFVRIVNSPLENCVGRVTSATAKHPRYDTFYVVDVVDEGYNVFSPQNLETITEKEYFTAALKGKME